MNIMEFINSYPLLVGGTITVFLAAVFNELPNLLDPRVNDGDDEEANVEVSTWKCEALPSERQG